MESLMVLVHSPLVGPFTWSLVVKPLQAGGFDVLVPVLTDSGETPPPYWQQHAVSVQQALVSIPQERPLVLVGHSGAGSLLPVLAQAARHPVKAYLFVDAGLPHPGKTQLEEMPEELRRLLASGERFPNWMDVLVSRCWRKCSRVPSPSLRKCCQMFPAGLMLYWLLGTSVRKIANFAFSSSLFA